MTSWPVSTAPDGTVLIAPRSVSEVRQNTTRVYCHGDDHWACLPVALTDGDKLPVVVQHLERFAADLGIEPATATWEAAALPADLR